MRSLGNPNFALSTVETLASKRNRLLFSLRRKVAYSRSGYEEKSCAEEQVKEWLQSQSPIAREEAIFLLNKFHFHAWIPHLSLETLQKNLATLWVLEQLLMDIEIKPEEILEPGCQDFNRLPAIAAFFSQRKARPTITGLEIDPFRILKNFYSRHDIAQYFRSQCRTIETEYFGADFFSYRPSWPADLILSFYPFVSPHPALAWGLPEELGNPDAWIDSIAANLRENGLALVMHQGKWEEEEFDEARARNSQGLKLLRRDVLNCPFYPQTHPAHTSLYTKTSTC